jgi:xanthine dehydrogenase small subunit
MFASTLIRNLATIGGNIVNASPVADITAMLLALDADLVILSQVQEGFDSSMKARTCRLEKFFLGYKTIDLKTTEVIRAIRIPCCDDPTARRFSFEKASKRKNLDIAAVNTAISFRIEEQKFKDVHISLGGVAPIPVISKAAMELLEGSFCPISDGKMMAELAKKTASSAETSVKPISDVRGSEEYRRRMVYRLMLAHFVRLFEDSGIAEELFP